MASDSLNPLSLLNCAVSSNENEHLCEKPVILSCGHYICKSCLPIGNQKVKCRICNMINNGALNKDIEHEAFNFILNEHLNQLFTVSFEKLDNIIKSFNEIVNNNNERIDNHVQFIQDEIQIHIESVKIRLDNIYESFVKQLQDIKIKWQLDNKNIKLDDFDLNKYQNELKELENNIKNKQNLTKDNLYCYQQQIRTIQQTINEFISRSPKLTFLPNESKIDENFVGKLKYEVDGDFDVRIKQKIKANDFESFDVGCDVDDISELPNGNVLFIDCVQPNILIYNKNKKLVKTVTEINNKTINIIGVATDGIDKIYFSDWDNCSIIKTDLELNHLITFGNGRGAATNQVDRPTGIHFFNQFLYVCDRDNKRIVKLDSNLVYQASFQLNYEPWYIKIMNNIAMIRPVESSIYFHDLNNFTIRKKYEGHNGIIGVSKEYFYEYYSDSKVFYCYDKNGEMVEEIQTNGLGLLNYNSWGTIATYNSNLYLSQNGSTSISIISSV